MFVTLLLGVYLIAHQQPTVSLELRGVRLENAVPMLTKTLGLESLEIGPTLRNEVVLVRTKDVDPETLKANLAKVLNGTWIHRKEGWWLTQTDEQKSADRKTYDKARYKFFTELVEKSTKKLSGMKPFDEANCKQLLQDLKTLSNTHISRNDDNIWRRISKIDEQSPMNRFAYRAALRITPDIWMKLTEENPRVVFCSRPNDMQQPFPFQIDDLVAAAMQEQNQWATYATGEPLQGPRAGQDQFDGYYGLGNLNQNRQPFKSTDLSTITMTIELTNQSISFSSYDSKGKSTSKSEVNFYDDSSDYSMESYRAEYEKMKKKMVKVTGEAAEYLDLVSPMNMYGQQNGKKKPISPSLLAKLLHPEKIDPLSISAPDVYLSSIDTPNVVMVMNDNQRLSRLPDFKDTRYARYNPSTIVDSDGWFLLSQPNPLANRKMMPDRKILGPMLRFIHDNNRPLNLEEQAAFATRLPWESDYSYNYLSHLNAIQSSEVEQYNSRSSLRIYGSMSPGQRERAKKGGIPFSALPQETKQEFYRAIFLSQRYEARVQMDYSVMGNMTQSQQRDFQTLQELMYGGIYEEKTFILPKGLTKDLMLTMEDVSTSEFYCGRPEPQGDEFYGSGRTMTATALGDYLFKLTNPQRYRWEVQQYNRIDENNIRAASKRVVTMKLKVSNLLYFSWALTQTLITDPTVYTAKTLPQSILDEVKKGYAQAEKNDRENGQFYGGYPTRINPPPL